MKWTPRYFQTGAIDGTFHYLEHHPGNPCIVQDGGRPALATWHTELPTGPPLDLAKRLGLASSYQQPHPLDLAA